MAGAHRGAGGLLGDQQPGLAHLLLQPLMVTGITALQRRAQHRHRAPAAGQATAMTGTIDAVGQAADHRPAGLGQGATDGLRHRQAMARRAPGADHRHGPAPGQMGPETAAAAPVEGQRRPLQGRDQRGECRIPRQQRPQPSRHLGRPGGQGLRPPAPTQRLQIGQPGGLRTTRPSEGLGRRQPGRRQGAELTLQRPQPHPTQPRTGSPEQPPEPALSLPAATRTQRHEPIHPLHQYRCTDSRVRCGSGPSPRPPGPRASGAAAADRRQPP